MRGSILALTAVSAIVASTSVRANDLAPCPVGMVCASDPATIVAALQKAGYKAEVTKDNSGDPEVDSSAGGYNYQVYSTIAKRMSTVSQSNFMLASRPIQR